MHLLHPVSPSNSGLTLTKLNNPFGLTNFQDQL